MYIVSQVYEIPVNIIKQCLMQKNGEILKKYVQNLIHKEIFNIIFLFLSFS